jgi:predicted alpha/beta-fold hydrolase
VSGFRPRPWTAGGHRQTLLGYWRRFGLAWSGPVEDLVVDAGDGVRLLLRASWQPGPRAERPALLIVHGLGGFDGAGYSVATAQLFWSRGWHVVRMNMRGAGDGVTLSSVLYNAGLDRDLVAALGAVAAHAPRLAAVGFSLGANLALLALGRREAELPAGLMGAVGVSPPVDLAACAEALDRPSNRLYQWFFMDRLRRAYAERQARRPDLYAPGLEKAQRTVREFDQAITARYGGYRDADDYYTRSSAGPLLREVRRRALLLIAADDPLIPLPSVTRWPLPASGSLTCEVLPTGGHVGFVAPTLAPGGFWAAERALAWLQP